ncbi:MAG TPA: YciC family protein [Caulobacter sp.]|nr:YciC family protein [Caulobacter sp.]
MTTLDAAIGGTFDFGRVVQRTFRIIGDNISLFAVAALVLVVTPVFLATTLGLLGKSAVTFGVSSIVGGLLAAVGGFVLQGVIVHVAISKLNGRAVETGEAVGVGARFGLPLFGLAIVSTLGLILGFTLLFVPGLILCVMWSVAVPALVMEKRGVLASLQRSRDLTRGHRWSIFGLLMVWFVISIVVSMVVQAISGVTGASTTLAGAMAGSAAPLTAGVVMATLLSAISSGLQGVIAAAGASSIYYELRTTKEGVAPDQLASVFD